MRLDIVRGFVPIASSTIPSLVLTPSRRHSFQPSPCLSWHILLFEKSWVYRSSIQTNERSFSCLHKLIAMPLAHLRCTSHDTIDWCLVTEPCCHCRWCIFPSSDALHAKLKREQCKMISLHLFHPRVFRTDAIVLLCVSWIRNLQIGRFETTISILRKMLRVLHLKKAPKDQSFYYVNKFRYQLIALWVLASKFGSKTSSSVS